MRTLLGLLLALLFAAPAVRAGEPAPVLAELARAAGQVHSLASDFVQEKHLTLFQEVLLSKGRFYFRQPDALRWELTEPVATGFVLRDGKGRRWHERTGAQQNFRIDSDPAMAIVAGQLLAWARVDIPWLEQNYRITVDAAAPVVLTLVPTAPGADQFLDHLRIVFSADRRHVAEVEVHERDGDFTRIRFTGTRVNDALPDSLF